MQNPCNSIYFFLTLVFLFVSAGINTGFAQSGTKDLTSMKLHADSLYQNGLFPEAADKYNMLVENYRKVFLDDSATYYAYRYMSALNQYEQNGVEEKFERIIKENIQPATSPEFKFLIQLPLLRHYTSKHAVDKALILGLDLLDFYRQNKINNQKEHADVCRSISYAYNSLGKSDSAIFYSLKGVDILERAQINNKELGYAYYGLALVYYDIDDDKNALLYYKKAIKNLEKNLPANHIHLAILYSAYSAILQLVNRYDDAENALLESIKIFEKNENQLGLVGSYYNLSLISSAKGRFKEMKLWLDKCKEVLMPIAESPDSRLASLYFGYATYEYGINGDHKKAIEYHQKSIEEKIGFMGQEGSALAIDYFGIARNYVALNEIENAMLYLNQSKDIYEDTGDTLGDEYYNVLYEMADIFVMDSLYLESANLYLDCLKHYEKAHRSDDEFVSGTILDILKLEKQLPNLINYDSLLYHYTNIFLDDQYDRSILLNKPNSLKLLNRRISEDLAKEGNEKFLKVTLNKIIDIKGNSIFYDNLNLYKDDGFIVDSVLKKMYLEGLKRLSEFNFNTDKENTLSDGLSLIKAMLNNHITSKINQETFLNDIGISSESYDEYVKIRNSIIELELQPKTEQDSLEDINQKRSTLGKSILAWKEDLSSKTPNGSMSQVGWNDNKNDESYLSYLNKDETDFLVFIEDGDSMFLFTTNGRSFILKSLGSKNEINLQIKLFLQKINQLSSVDEITQISKKLYDLLLAPAEVEWNKKLWIVSSSSMQGLNFELLTKEKTTTKLWKEVAWLGKDHIVKYTNHLPRLSKKRVNSIEKKPLILVPGFADQQRTDDESITTLSPSLASTPWTLEMAKDLYDKYGGKLLAGNESNLSNWKKFASDHEIIHFGTHAIVDKNEPMKSYLALDGKGDKLSFFDIYTQNVNANLIVLAACETGLGSDLMSQGNLSLAYAFQFAGCKNSIHSLWKIDDETTNVILSNFYEHYFQGLDADESMFLAKKKYLKEQNESFCHPYYWAGIIHSQYTFEPKSNKLLYLFASAILLPIIFFGYKKFYS